MFVLSHYQARSIQSAWAEGSSSLTVSTDLGITHTTVQLNSQGVCFPDGEIITWAELEEIIKSEVSCFKIEQGVLKKIQVFSEETGRFYSLMPTSGAPTMLLSGIPMHRIKGIDPYQDTLRKIKAIQPIVGETLDTTMGLGYTAIQASKTAAHVTTIELDPAVVRLAAQNPWSRELFDNPKINQLVGDSYDLIETFADGTFSRVIHDPPMFSLAGDLYSKDFYQQIFRVLKNNGKLFHYIGDLESPSGSRTAKGAARRLEEAGFLRVKYEYSAFGLTAIKQFR
jgi:uncharacterized protein